MTTDLRAVLQRCRQVGTDKERNGVLVWAILYMRGLSKPPPPDREPSEFLVGWQLSFPSLSRSSSRSLSLPIFVPILVPIFVDKDRDKDRDKDILRRRSGQGSGRGLPEKAGVENPHEIIFSVAFRNLLQTLTFLKTPFQRWLFVKTSLHVIRAHLSACTHRQISAYPRLETVWQTVMEKFQQMLAKCTTVRIQARHVEIL